MPWNERHRYNQYQYVSLDVTHMQTVRSVQLLCTFTSLGLLKWKERPGYAVDGARQLMGTIFITGESGMSSLDPRPNLSIDILLPQKFARSGCDIAD